MIHLSLETETTRKFLSQSTVIVIIGFGGYLREASTTFCATNTNTATAESF